MIYTSLAIGFGVVALLSLVGAWVKRNKRVPFAWAFSSALVTAAAAFYHEFWPVPAFGLMTIWALITSLNVISMNWRVKVGLTIAIALGALFAIFPTVHDEVICSEKRGDAIPASCPAKLAELDGEQRAEAQEKAERGDAGFVRWMLSNMSFRMVRGLDLKGGLRLVYTVDVDEAIRDKRDRYYDDLRERLTKSYGLAAGDNPTIEEMRKLADLVTLHKPREQVDTIVVEFKNPEDSKKHVNDKFLTTFLRELTVVRAADGSKITFQIRNDVETLIRQSAVRQAKQTIERRIDGLGVKEAAVLPRDEDIIIEIPGNDERAFGEIRDIISQTARLEFKLLDDGANFFEQFAATEGPEGLSFEIENAPLGPGKSQPSYFARMKALKGEDLEGALTRLKEWTASLPVDEDHEIGFAKVFEYDEDKDVYDAVGWRTYYLWAKAELTGDQVREATAQADQSDTGFGQWYVSMDLTPRGAETFATITEQNVKKRFAIILDGKVESAPEIREKIGGGTARITMGSGGMQQQLADAKKLELVLKSGALPAPISPSNEQRIGPSLGADAIDSGLKGAALGSAFVILLMFLFYKRAGTIAVIAVGFNILLQLTVLSMFSASMTLPGIAGLALTVGMAVDANVLINERIIEELKSGKGARAAVQLGYDRAFSAIVDGNATTLISAFVLAQYGTGPIKGFAVTLIVGMICNLYTGVVVTRLFFEFWVRGRRNVDLGMT
ncbi:MAG: protein translocase subunit SecD [Myxococcales bacterium]|nr:protein translocase subunit SecD [Myxococcales bacterium]